jgi:chemotaxis protein MotA
MKTLDRLTPIACGAALFAIIFSMVIEGSSPAVLFKPAPLILVFGGTFMASAAGFMKSDMKSIKAVLMQAIGTPEASPTESIAKIVSLAEVARKEGILSLEKAAGEIDDPFFRKGLEMTVDGVDPEEIEDILEGEIEQLRERHRMGAKFFQDMGGFSPTLGIIGTVVGLIHVLGNLNDPNSIGAAIGSAFTATLWGVLAANIFWLPISNKLKRASELEVTSKRMIVEGLLAVQAGNSPRMIQARLQAFVPKGTPAEGSQEAA